MTCDSGHSFTQRYVGGCPCCLRAELDQVKAELAFEHLRWKLCARDYAQERARRQELERCPLNLYACADSSQNPGT